MQIVVPMAGAGKRFSDAGYTVPKPLIPVSGQPMVVQAVQDLPPAGRILFLCQVDHLRLFPLEETLCGRFPQAIVIPVEGLTEGQASTVRLAGSFLDPNEPVIVAACDNTHLYEPQKHLQLLEDETIEAAVWTYRGEPRVLVAPQMYGWVRTHKDSTDILEVSVKRPISDNPLEDPVVSGTFTFRKAGVMLDAIDELVRLNHRVNGEFYMDSVPNLLIRRGRRAVVFEVEKYIG
ncbi:MAG: NTP transferase domain-containing protein, partial [Armatimonadota bacterium]|nr:NTP transferase domain-containing protein [Armatimonadota bacterium]